MILVSLLVILLAGGGLAWIVGTKYANPSRWIALLALLANLVLVVRLWIVHLSQSGAEAAQWLVRFNKPWIPAFGIDLHLAVDGLSLLMLTLTYVLGVLAVLISWKQIKERTGFFHFNLLWVLAGITGVFLALDLFLFYFCWELMLIPMYFLIGIWGYENRIYASYKFFIFTQASGLLMFLAIIGLYLIHGSQTGHYTFNFETLLDTELTRRAALLLMGGFVTAFIVKLPAFPFHNWLPDAHTEAPTAGSVILAGLLLKTGAYGLIRFVLPMFPEAAAVFAPWGMLLGVIGILYGAKLAFAQTDLKRLVAYTSVSHMGFIMLGVFALNELAIQGVVVQMIAHGISTGALFTLVGMMQERTHTRDIRAYSGLWASAPKMGVAALIFAMASLGLPGMANFIAEFLILAGAFQVNMLYTILAALGLIGATLYSLRLFQHVFQGESKGALTDLNARETLTMAVMVAMLFGIGLYPRPVLNSASPPVSRALNIVHAPKLDDTEPKAPTAHFFDWQKEDQQTPKTLDPHE